LANQTGFGKLPAIVVSSTSHLPFLCPRHGGSMVQSKRHGSHRISSKLRSPAHDVRCARPVYVDHIVGRGADLFEHMRGISAEATASPRGETLG
jgi:hypothetical protein